MGTLLQSSGLTDKDFHLRERLIESEAYAQAYSRIGPAKLDGCNELLNLTRPDVVRRIHDAYLAAGSDLIETNTFGCTDVVLAEYDVPELVYDIALAAARIAREAVDAAPGPRRYVVGALGPGTKLVTLGQVGFDDIVSTYATGFRALLEGGSDALLLETLQDLLMVKAAILGARRAMADTERTVPLMVQVTIEQTGTMLLGTEVGAALNYLECFPCVQVVGINCATGPVEMAPFVRFLGQNSTRPISVQPNAGLPQMEGGHAVYRLSPAELADAHVRFIQEDGVAMVGGCCGTTPEHLRAVRDAVNGLRPNPDAHWVRTHASFPGFDFRLRQPEQADAFALKGCSSLYQFQPYAQDNSILIVGERTNANGSRAFREMLNAENWDGLTELAREQEQEGAHVLDVCAAYVGRNEVHDMQRLLERLNRAITVPLMIDSTEVDVMEASLKAVAGKAILNSINFEDGEKRARLVLELARNYGAGVVALTIDEDGMAKSAERKLLVADRLLALTREFGLPDQDVFIDALTFTLGSGDEEFRSAGIETLEAIRLIHAKYPRVNSILGISNISFGLRPSARQVLNSVFLAEAERAGLTAAIVHSSKIVPLNRVEAETWGIAEDLVFDRRQFAIA